MYKMISYTNQQSWTLERFTLVYKWKQETGHAMYKTRLASAEES